MAYTVMPDSEKLTINMGAVDLGKVDLLVAEGVYSNRTDFIRSAIRSQLEKHQSEVAQSVARHGFMIGVLSYDRKTLEKLRSKGKTLQVTVLGMLHLSKDVTPDLARDVLESVKVRGILSASSAVRDVLADRQQ